MLKKLFTNDKFFLVATVFSVLTAIVSLVLFLLSGISLVDFGLFNLLSSNMLVPLCVIGLYKSYQSHNKNIMKYLMGLLMAIAALVDLYFLSGYIASNKFNSNYVIIIYVLLVVLDFVLIGNHLVLNSDHGSHPTNIKTNQITIFILAILNVTNFIVFAFNPKYNGTSLEVQIGMISTMLTYLFAYTSIVCVESRLDFYKAIREQKLD